MLNNLKNKKIGSALLAIIILVLLLICSFVLFFEVNEYRNIETQKHNFYYYFSDIRIDFEGTITLNSKDAILSLTNDNITLNSSPVFYIDDTNKMILPQNMEIVYPYKLTPMYQVGKFSKISNEKGVLYLKSEIANTRIYDCFLYDGKDLYVFVDDTTVFVGENKYQLNPMSFVEVTKNYVRLYNKKADEFIFLKGEYGKVEAYTSNYFINLIEDSLTYNNEYYMLIKNIDGLKKIEIN